MASLLMSAAKPSNKDSIYVAAMPLRASKGLPQMLMSLAFSLNLRDLQHYMVIIKPSSSALQTQVHVFDFQPQDPENASVALSALSGKRVPESSFHYTVKGLKQLLFIMDAPEPRVDLVDEYGALAYVGRWGIHRISLPSMLMQRYELGRLLGQGTFAKAYYARNLKSGESVVVKLYEVMATKTKIYFVMEYAKGGKLFNKVAKGKLKEDVTRRYFQQLINAVDFCHSRSIYHRNLKPDNLLLDENVSENSVKITSEAKHASETKQAVARPSNLNAFDIISLSTGFDLSGNQMPAHEPDWMTKTVTLCFSLTLRSIRIGVFQGNERELHTLEFLLKNGLVLETMYIVTCNVSLNESLRPGDK
ncbi:hypothetical protein GIB67_023689 [Kingdonia uniflora]|uniref:non-specific serine/threonine protein kinase n=1 Tax=Kingdonia uniflora TaxID=39325 RepID=A0A7J7MGG5_9MAGN|nr:hypothetical protein GIB67_023689 [Kingdonia uniflora]